MQNEEPSLPHPSSPRAALLALAGLGLLAGLADAQGRPEAPGPRFRASRIDAFTPGFADTLDPGDQLGSDLALLGDLDGDGAPELAVGAPGSCQRGRCDGALWILTADPVEGLVGRRLVAPRHGGFEPEPFATPLGIGMGRAVAALGDLDGDGVGDLAVGTTRLSDSFWVLFLDGRGRVKSQRVVPGPGPGLGHALETLGDLDGDGTVEVAAQHAGPGSALYVTIFSLDPTGAVQGEKTLGGDAGLGGVVPLVGSFGRSLARVPDLDGDGCDELAVGSDELLSLLFLGPDFLEPGVPVRAQVDLNFRSAGLAGIRGTSFGAALASPGDLDGDGRVDLAVGAEGSVWILFLNADGTARTTQVIGEGQGGFGGSLGTNTRFGEGLEAAGDLDGNGVGDLFVGEPDQRAGRGAVWTLLLDATGSVIGERILADRAGSFEGNVDDDDRLASAVAAVASPSGPEAARRLLVGAPRADDGGANQGAVWVLDVGRERVRTVGRISGTRGGLAEPLAPGDRLGSALAAIDDWNGDGVPDAAVGLPGDDDVAPDQGALLLLALDAAGQVAAERKIGGASGGFGGFLRAGDEFGSAVVQLDDLDGDGTRELAVGAPFDDDGFADAGAVWILFRNPDGSVKAEQKIGQLEGSLVGPLTPGARFGTALAAIADLDGDGRRELAVGAPGGANGQGLAWILFLADDGTVRAENVLGSAFGPIPGLAGGDAFGSSLAPAGDPDRNGVSELAVGAPFHDQGGPDRGAVFLVELGPAASVLASSRLGHGDSGLELQDDDRFGQALGTVTFPGDRPPVLLVGSFGDDAGGTNHGALWVLTPRAGAGAARGAAADRGGAAGGRR